MAKNHRVFLLLGSNIHPREAWLEKAERLVSSMLGDVIRGSSLYGSEPWGFEAEVAFLNKALCVETSLEPLDLLGKTQEIERMSGRTKKPAGTRYVSRTLDIDILFYDDRVVRLPGLMVPHPRMADRRFALLPLVEIAPDKVHPVLKRNIRQLLSECRDEGKVWKYKEMPFHAV